MPDAPHSQARGVSLIIVLVVLAVILVGSLAMLRSSEVSSLVAGNVSFRKRLRRRPTSASAMRPRRSMSRPISTPTSPTPTSPRASRRTATAFRPRSTGLRCPPSTVGNYSVQHVVERLCQTTPVTDPTGSCMVRDSEARRQQQGGLARVQEPGQRVLPHHRARHRPQERGRFRAGAGAEVTIRVLNQLQIARRSPVGDGAWNDRLKRYRKCCAHDSLTPWSGS